MSKASYIAKISYYYFYVLQRSFKNTNKLTLLINKEIVWQILQKIVIIVFEKHIFFKVH